MVAIGRSGTVASLAGLAAGLALCFGTLRVMRTVIYGVGVYDLTTLAGTAAILAVVMMAATVLPVLRIAKIDPARTVREE